ncbi:MAG TPA: SBBP repeat-containing protein [Candidatus Kapabacteria bacterium]|nr:SBBP repeat-containing protein [Candidatus Kapabacteria bacterium]
MKYTIRFVCCLAVLLLAHSFLDAQQATPFLGNDVVSHPGIKTLPSQFQLNSGIRFIENKGQIADTKGNSRPDIKYYTESANGVRMYFSADKVSYVFAQYDTARPPLDPLLGKEGKGMQRNFQNSLSPLLRGTTGGQTLYRMDMSLLGASPTVIEREGESEDYNNYYYAHCPHGVTNVHSYSTITYKNIYPNIDLVYRQNAGGVKYDLIVNPGGRVSDIRLQYTGADNLSVTSNGKMQIASPFGKVQEDIPYTYQINTSAPSMLDAFDSHNDGAVQSVAASYHVSNNVITFDVGAYDRTRPLVIDPTLEWSTFYGGSGDEDRSASTVAVDSENNVIITGTTVSTDFPVTAGAIQKTYKGNDDIFVVKFGTKGNVIWATYYGGTKYELGLGAAADKQNNIFISGSTASTDFPVTNGAFQTTLKSDQSRNGASAYIVKLDSAGMCQWATYFGGSYNDGAFYDATDGNGDVIITGLTQSTDLPVTPGAYQTTYNSRDWKAFIAKFDHAGNRLWATYYGGSIGDEGIDVATDDNDNIIIVGNTESTDFPTTPGAFQSPPNFLSANNDFLSIFDRNGNCLWATLYTGNSGGGGTVPDRVAIDRNDNVVFTGWTDDHTFPTTPGSFQPTMPPMSSGSAYIVKFDGAGNRLWATYYGGNGNILIDGGTGIATDANGNIFITGSTSSGTTFPITNDAFQRNITEPSSYIVELDATGARKYATQFGSASDTTYGSSLTVDKYGNVIISGNTNANAPSFPITPGAVQKQNNGLFDAFVAKFCMLNMSVQPAPNGSVCKGDSVTIGGSAITGGTPPYSYQWSPAKWLNSTTAVMPIASPDSTTRYYETVTDAGACMAMDTVTVFVRPSLRVTISGSMATCRGTRVGLNANVAGGKPPYTYIWRPSYGLSSTNILDPSAKPDSTTVYYLTAIDSNGCSGIDSVLVKINQPPQLNAGDTLSRTICKGSAVTIGGLPVSGATPFRYNWSPGTGLSATNIASPVANPTTTTTYTVIITDVYGCQSIGKVTVKVGSSLSPVITVNGSTTLCGNDSVVLDAGNGYATYLWTTGDTTETIVVNKAGTYSVACSDSTGCSGRSDTITITQGRTPSPLIAGSDTVCMNAPSSYSVNNVAGDIYTWSVTGGTIVSGANTNSVSVQWNTPGNATIVITETDGTSRCSASAMMRVTVDSSVVPAIAINGTVTFCTGDSVTLSAPAGFATYLWSDGETTQSIVVRTSGTYTVTVTSVNGCSGTSAPIAVTVGSTLTPVITGAPAFCPGDSTVLDAGAGYGTYQWSTGATTETIVVKAPGTYSVSVTKGTCAGSSANFTVTEYPEPTVAITVSGDTLISSPAASYQWNMNGVPIAGATQQRYVAIITGSYTVTITDANGCTVSSPAYIPVANAVDVCIDAFPSTVSPKGFMTATMNLTNEIFLPIDSIVFDLHFDPRVMELDSIGESPCSIKAKYIAAGEVRIRLEACSTPLPAGALCTAVFTPLVSSNDTAYTQLAVDSIAVFPLADSLSGTGCSVPITVLPLCGLHGVIYTGATSLAQNYPNPFTGTTAIHVTLSQTDAQSARLVVCNVLGEQVADLTNELSTDGNITFNAGANKAGVYYYVLETASGRITRQMFVVK